jgi:hypothetical protein
VCDEGGTASVKIWVKIRKIVGSATLLVFKLRSSFYTSRRGGGSEAQIRRMARWGLQVNRHGTLLLKLTSILVYVLRLLFHTAFCTGRTYVKQTLDGAKILNDSTEKQYQCFNRRF